MIRTVDYHTAGEPFRIVVEGVPDIPGATVAQRRAAALASEELGTVRRLLCHEPRGHADMYGCFPVPPDDAGAHLGAIFWHKDGFSTACGHGTIALGVWAVDSGLVPAVPDGVTDVVVDVPSGRVTARVRRSGGRTRMVSFRNVPSYVVARGMSAAGAGVDIAYGGAFYACVPAAAYGLTVTPADLGRVIEVARLVRADLDGHPATRHTADERLSGLYGVVFHEPGPERGPGSGPGPDPGSGGRVLHQRNVTVFTDGEVDRSPCGSGTAARLALLHADGQLARGWELVHESIIGTRFVARVAQVVPVEGGGSGVVTEVDGMAYRTGEHSFVLEPDDPLGPGFVLR
ncbi:MAG TPA: proline racemase family protein [Micromonosporaceae bacterium]|nr:proline racemase family protein [Micromonosporaceae bacterium]